jgi:hypothetical protein
MMKRLSIILLAIAIITVPVFLKADSTESAGTVGVAQELAAAPGANVGWGSITNTLVMMGIRRYPLAAPVAIMNLSLAATYANDSWGTRNIDFDYSWLGSKVVALVDYRPDAIATAKAQTAFAWWRSVICEDLPTWTSPGPGPGPQTKRAMALCKGGFTVEFETASDSFDTFIDIDLENFFVGADPSGTSSYSLDITDLGPSQISPYLPPEIKSAAEDEGFTEAVPTTSYFSLQVSFNGSTGDPSITATSFGSPLPDVEDDFVTVDGDPPGVAYVGNTISIPVTLPLGTDVNLNAEALSVAEGPPVGGTVELLGQSDSPADASDSTSSRDYTAPIAAAAAVAAFVALAGGGWYVRRRFLR